MNKSLLFVLTIIFLIFTGCDKKDCTDDSNATITGYDQTKGLCGTGFIMVLKNTSKGQKTQYLVRELEGDYASNININSKFPIKIVFKDQLTPIENCPNVISKLAITKPKSTCF